jgi:hypothetical protein
MRFTYEVEVDYADGTREVVEVSGVATPAEAVKFVRDRDPDVEQATVVAWLEPIEKEEAR